MKRVASMLVWATGALAFAGGELGTKADPLGVPSSPSASAVGIMPIMQMLIALGIVYALLRFVFPKVMAKMGKKLKTGIDSTLKVEESATFPGGSLYIVQARHRTLLLGVSGQGTTMLADLTVDKPYSSEPSFQELVDQASDQPIAEAIIEPAPHVELALERLRKLAG